MVPYQLWMSLSSIPKICALSGPPQGDVQSLHKKLNIPMIGYRFLGQAHSTAFCPGVRFIYLRYKPGLKAASPLEPTKRSTPFSENWEMGSHHKTPTGGSSFSERLPIISLASSTAEVPHPIPPLSKHPFKGPFVQNPPERNYSLWPRKSSLPQI